MSKRSRGVHVNEGVTSDIYFTCNYFLKEKMYVCIYIYIYIYIYKGGVDRNTYFVFIFPFFSFLFSFYYIKNWWTKNIYKKKILRVSLAVKDSLSSWNKLSKRPKEREEGRGARVKKRKRKRKKEKNDMKGIRRYVEVHPPFLA